MTTSTTDSSSGDDRLAELVDEFGERLRAGETPDVEEFAARLPGREAELREYLSTVAQLEHADPRAEESTIGGFQFTQVGPYRIEREIGRGGMGVVFLATDEQLGRQVALKFLPAQATLDKRFLKRFRREARAAGQLTHPHIVPVFGAGEHATLHYYAMQFVDGHGLDQVVGAVRDWSGDETPSVALAKRSIGATVADMLRRDWSAGSADSLRAGDGSSAPPVEAASRVEPARGRVYFQNVARLGVQVADALAYAHSHGIVHRDIKPSNLLLDSGGHVWVTDFGLCTTSESDQLTMSDDMVGTLRYMAPEQIEGHGDLRSDEYGLGITLYEMLTLRPAFEGRDRAGLMRRVAELQPPRPRKLDPSIPRDLESIVLKSTAKLPEDRYGSAEALARDLRAFLDGRPIAAQPPSPLRLLRLAIRRNRVLASTIAAALLVLLFITWFYIDGLRAARDEQDRNLYEASIAAAAAAASNPRMARSFLDRAPRALRSWEWEHLDVSLDSSLFARSTSLIRIDAFDSTPDGQRAVVAGLGAVVVELGAEGREWSFETPYITSLDISPDGREVALAGESRVLRIALDGEPELITNREGPQSRCWSTCYDTTGERIFVGTNEGSILCYTADLSEQLFTLSGTHGSVVMALAPTPDGKALVSGGADGAIRFHVLETLEPRLLGRFEGRVHALDVDPAGGLVATGGSDGSVRLWDAWSGRAIATWHEHQGVVHSVRFTADGRQLISAGADRRVRTWDVVEGTSLAEMTGHDSKVLGLVELPDGRFASAESTGTIRAWHPAAAGGEVLLAGHVADLWSLAFDASGARLLSTARDNTVRVWDAATGKQLRVFVRATPASAEFLPDGESILVGYKDGGLREWSLASGECTWVELPQGDEARIERHVAVDSSGARFFTMHRDHLAEAWQRADEGWERRAQVDIPGAASLALSPSGDLLALGCYDGTAIVLETEGLTPLFRTAPVGAGFVCVEFSPDEQKLAVGGVTGVVSLFRMDGTIECSFRVETEGSRDSSAVWGLAFDPAGRRLACATENLGITLWDPARGVLVARFQGRGRGNTWVQWSPDGERIASASWIGLIRVWDTLSAEERLERVRRTEVDALGLEHAELGSFAGLHAAAMRSLRSVPATREHLSQGYSLAHGLLKEFDHDPRSRAVAGEAYYRFGNLELAREHLLASIRAAELTGDPGFDAHVFLAMVAARTGSRDEAFAAFDLAHQLADESDEHARLLEEARQLVDGLGE